MSKLFGRPTAEYVFLCLCVVEESMKSLVYTPEILQARTADLLNERFGLQLRSEEITVNLTRKEFQGAYTLVLFPLLKYSGGKPEELGQWLGNSLMERWEAISGFNLVKGFLNLSFSPSYWLGNLDMMLEQQDYGKSELHPGRVLLEYCGPNTNKPLHIGHLRNMMLGFSMARILEAAGQEVIKVNIYNDRGIAICKSMAAWLETAQGETPESSGMKGDHFVGKYYVKYNALVKEQLESISDAPAEKEEAEKLTPIHRLAVSLLQKWENGDEETLALWRKMNGWVYQGFEVTYQNLGVDFQKNYYESETYLTGKAIVEEGLEKGVFYRRADGAVCVDLTADGLDEKVLLRSDGTSVYITQDLGTADLRFEEFKMDQTIYVVADEQNYHFKVLKLALMKLGKLYAPGIYHLSYGLVESPTGRFKSREGKTADADDLVSGMLEIAEKTTRELGKVEGLSPEEANQLYNTIGLGALKYFLLRVNPVKKIIFNPEESIDFHGHTGPFIQYTYARIRSLERKAGSLPEAITSMNLHESEYELLIHLHEFPQIIRTAAAAHDPSEVANYLYHLARLFNKFYAELSVLNAENPTERAIRIRLASMTGRVIKKGMFLLGISVPERM